MTGLLEHSFEKLEFLRERFPTRAIYIPILRRWTPAHTRPFSGAHSGRRSTCVKPVVSATAYLRAAQAYMLISMPTGTSTIFGVFQAISALLLARGNAALGR
jgi:hypothetical protein